MAPACDWVAWLGAWPPNEALLLCQKLQSLKESVTFRNTEGPFSCQQDYRASGDALESWSELPFLGKPQVGEPHVAFQGLVIRTQVHAGAHGGKGAPDRALCAPLS